MAEKNKLIIIMVISTILVLLLVLNNKDYKEESLIANNNLNKFSSTLPSKFDLRDQNGSNFLTPVKDQGFRGTCWAFTSSTSMESALLVNNYSDPTNPTILSPYQIDFALSNNGIVDYIGGDRALAGGIYGYDTGEYLTKGTLPVKLEYFNENNYADSPLEYDQVINFKDMDYTFPEYYSFDYASEKDQIKEYLMEYGAMYLGTLAPSVSPKCMLGEYGVIDTNIGCNSTGGHAMTLIGWDDDFEFELDGEQVHGAFILQNSWGKDLPYLYLAYESGVSTVVGFKKPVSVDYNKVYNNPTTKTEDGKTLIEEFSKTNVTEEIRRISFGQDSPIGTKFDIYIGQNDEYQLVDSVYAYRKGRISLSLNDDNYSSNLKTLNNESFQIKIVSDNDKTTYIDEDIYVFTYYDEETTTPTLSIDEQSEDVFYYSKMLNIRVSTTNDVSKNDISMKIFDESNNEISTDELSFYGVIRRDSSFVFTYQINKKILKENYIVKLYYQNNLVDTESYHIESLEPVSLQGDGSINYPFIITTPEQLQKINTNEEYLEFNYELGSNIDLNNKTLHIGTSDIPFTGSFNGNNYIIKNYTISNTTDTYQGLFTYTKNATIHNVIFKNCTINGNNSAFLVGKDENSEIYGISVFNSTINGSSNGSIIGFGKNGNYYLLYSNAKVSDRYSMSGLFNIINNSTISHSAFNGELSYTQNHAAYAKCLGTKIEGSHISYIDCNFKVPSNNRIVGLVSDSTSNVFDNIFINIDSESSNNNNSYISEYSKYTTYNNLYIVDKGYKKEPISSSDDTLTNITTSTTSNSFILDQNNWEYVNNYPRIKQLRYYDNYYTPPGVSHKYLFDEENAIIYNVRAPRQGEALTLEGFLNYFETFNGEVYDPTGTNKLTNDGDPITTGTVVKYDNQIWRVAVMGKVNTSDTNGKIDIGDASAMQRVIARLPLSHFNIDDDDATVLWNYAGDLKCSGKMDISDVSLLRRRLAVLPIPYNIYETDGPSCYETVEPLNQTYTIGNVFKTELSVSTNDNINIALSFESKDTLSALSTEINYDKEKLELVDASEEDRYSILLNNDYDENISFLSGDYSKGKEGKVTISNLTFKKTSDYQNGDTVPIYLTNTKGSSQTVSYDTGIIYSDNGIVTNLTVDGQNIIGIEKYKTTKDKVNIEAIVEGGTVEGTGIVTLKNGINSFDITISNDNGTSTYKIIIEKVLAEELKAGNPNTIDKIVIAAIILISSLILFIYLKNKKEKKYTV